jgi:drug/metabolite transporter (DMT)-like permease
MTRGAALALMVAAPVLWSSAGVVTRHIERTEPIEQVFLAQFLRLCLCRRRVAFSRERIRFWRAVAAGGAGLFSGALWAVMFTAFVIALSLTTTANTLVMMSIAPLLTVVCARIVLTDPIPLRTWLAALAAMAGIASCSVHPSTTTARGRNASRAGDSRGLGLERRALRKHSATLDLIPAVMLGGALSALIALPLALPISALGNDLALLAFLGVFQLGLPCMFLVMASRALLAPEIALLGLLEVVLGRCGLARRGRDPAASTLTGGALWWSPWLETSLRHSAAGHRNARYRRNASPTR